METSAAERRARQRAATRAEILSAVLDLVAEGRSDDLAVPDVSRRSGISLATIYRYFPTKDALLDAAAVEPALAATGTTLPPADGPEYLRLLWRSFTERLPLVRRQAASAAGREMRVRRLETSRGWFAARIRAMGIEPDSPDGARLVRVALLLTSSLAFLELHDRQGLDPDAAVDDVDWALRALEGATRAGGVS